MNAIRDTSYKLNGPNGVIAKTMAISKREGDLAALRYAASHFDIPSYTRDTDLTDLIYERAGDVVADAIMNAIYLEPGC